MTNHAVVIVGGGPTGLMLAGELALANADVAIVERRPSQEVAGSRAGGLHSRTLEVSISAGLPIGSSPRGRKRRSSGLPGSNSISAAFPLAIPIVSDFGRNKSSESLPTGSTNSECRSIAASK
jgi:3-(3-hydroxy-phenyl)propionate hydroxylase